MRSTIAAVLIFASLQSLDCFSGASNSRLNFFDIDLLRYCTEGKSGNVMVSPASIKSTLTMLMDGALGATAAEIETALRLTPHVYNYKQLSRAYMQALQVNTTSIFVQSANALFVSKKLQVNKRYEKTAKDHYLSEVSNLDFNDPRTSADIINGWVSSKTKGLIPNVIDQAHISPQTELLVTNALYFKGTWLHEFEPKMTHAECFFKDGVCRNVAMMNLDAELNYAYVDNLRAHAVELPYESKRHSMILLVPQHGVAVAALIRDLPYMGLLEISKMLQPSDVVLTMPKFTIEYSNDLVSVLKNIGITTLFSPAANLSDIFADSTASGHLDSIFHKVYMQVDEKGTLAAAATAGMVVPLINNFIELKIDRPFLFFIWDNEEGVILFEGKIEDPTELVDLHNKFGNNGQGTVKPQQIPNKTPGPNSQSIPIQQQVPSQPIENAKKPVSSQPIQPTNQQIHAQPIQPTNQPIYAQPIQPISNQPVFGQPIQQTNQPIQSSNQPMHSTNQPITTQTSTEPPTSSPPITRNNDNKKWWSIFG